MRRDWGDEDLKGRYPQWLPSPSSIILVVIEWIVICVVIYFLFKAGC